MNIYTNNICNLNQTGSYCHSLTSFILREGDWFIREHLGPGVTEYAFKSSCTAQDEFGSIYSCYSSFYWHLNIIIAFLLHISVVVDSLIYYSGLYSVSSDIESRCMRKFSLWKRQLEATLSCCQIKTPWAVLCLVRGVERCAILLCPLWKFANYETSCQCQPFQLWPVQLHQDY